MDNTVLAVRAIGSEYGLRLLRPIAIIILTIYVAILAMTWTLAATVSPWWWLLIILPTFILLVLTTLWIVSFLIVRRVRPALTKHQKKLTKDIVGNINTVAEQFGTPRFVILYRILKDVLGGTAAGRTYIGEMASTPGEMRRKFEELRKSF